MSAGGAVRATSSVRALAAVHAHALAQEGGGGAAHGTPRASLRGGGSDGPPSGGRPRVVRIEPPDGASGVLRDHPVVAILSHPIDATSLTTAAFCVAGPGGPAAGQVRASLDGRVLVWTPERLLEPDGEHHVRVAGLRDSRGQDVAPHLSRFVPCRLSSSDLMA